MGHNLGHSLVLRFEYRESQRMPPAAHPSPPGIQRDSLRLGLDVRNGSSLSVTHPHSGEILTLRRPASGSHGPGAHLMIPPKVCTVNETPLLATPPNVTTTFPVVAPTGTATLIEVGLQLEMVVAFVPLNSTVPLEPKFAPTMVTDAPTFPDVGERLVMVGDAANSVPVKAAATRARITSRHAAL